MTTCAASSAASVAARRATPHMREFLADTLTPLGVYRRLRAVTDRSFLLESITGGEQVSRFSFIGADPSVICRLWADRLEIEKDGETRNDVRPPLEALEELLSSVEGPSGEIPLTGGWVGFLGYDTIRLVERLPNRPPDPHGLPYAVLARFDSLVVFDHARQRVVAVANEIEGEVDRAVAEVRLEELATLLTEGVDGGGVEIPAGAITSAETQPATLSSEQYQAAVCRAKDYIRAGD
ncbi:MAG: hypothetical protein VYE73_06875, partial [Acidobacteriota bacterium]|nr:hypothetical protein [Acidobacteriota bacterium]